MNSEVAAFSDGKDSVVIRRHISSVIGGAVLDCEGFTPDEIRVGHVIIRETAHPNHYKPLGITDGAYSDLPDEYEYAGVSTTSTTKENPLVGVMYAGEVNDVASPYSVASIKSALKTALPQLVFLHD